MIAELGSYKANNKGYFDEIQSGTRFCHYTTIDSARKIISGETIYLNCFDNMNDLSERDDHKYEKDQVFTVSFCHSETKSIPLFYLYSGIDGKGCRMEFSAAKLREMIEKNRSFIPLIVNCVV